MHFETIGPSDLGFTRIDAMLLTMRINAEPSRWIPGSRFARAPDDFAYAWLAAVLPSAACAAARRAIGTRYGEHDT